MGSAAAARPSATLAHGEPPRDQILPHVGREHKAQGRAYAGRDTGGAAREAEPLWHGLAAKQLPVADIADVFRIHPSLLT